MRHVVVSVAFLWLLASTHAMSAHAAIEQAKGSRERLEALPPLPTKSKQAHEMMTQAVQLMQYGVNQRLMSNYDSKYRPWRIAFVVISMIMLLASSAYGWLQRSKYNTQWLSEKEVEIFRKRPFLVQYRTMTKFPHMKAGLAMVVFVVGGFVATVIAALVRKTIPAHKCTDPAADGRCDKKDWKSTEDYSLSAAMDDPLMQIIALLTLGIGVCLLPMYELFKPNHKFNILRCAVAMAFAANTLLLICLTQTMFPRTHTVLRVTFLVLLALMVGVDMYVAFFHSEMFKRSQANRRGLYINLGVFAGLVALRFLGGFFQFQYAETLLEAALLTQMCIVLVYSGWMDFPVEPRIRFKDEWCGPVDNNLKIPPDRPVTLRVNSRHVQFIAPALKNPLLARRGADNIGTDFTNVELGNFAHFETDSASGELLVKYSAGEWFYKVEQEAPQEKDREGSRRKISMRNALGDDVASLPPPEWVSFARGKAAKIEARRPKDEGVLTKRLKASCILRTSDLT